MAQTENQFSAIAFLTELIQQIGSPDYDLAQQRLVIQDGLQKVMQEMQQTKDFDFREIGDHLYDGIYIADGNGKTLYVNKAYTRITGIQPEEIVGKYVRDCESASFYKNAVTPEVIKHKQQVNSMGESMRNGNKMLISGNPIFDDAGNVKKVVVVDRDITDLLTMKAELESSQQKMKAVENDQFRAKQEIEHLRKSQLNKNLLGNTPEIQKIVQMIEQVAPLDVTVLITGETGSGKEVVANEIYLNSNRPNGPFIKVNCAAIPANLLEAELFGYEKGSFTGANQSGKLGMFELADKGTLLLDEIGEMSLELQSKLLRVIQHKEITRIGGTKSIKLDIRIISSTNCNLLQLVKQGRFREDLYYRLNVFPIQIPPLRQRSDDIELLARHFLNVYTAKYGIVTVIEETGFELLKEYAWPGNIRELQNIIERLVIVAGHGSIIRTEQIAALLNIDPYYTALVHKELGLKEIVENVERKTIEKVLSLHKTTRKAAKILKIDQSTIVKKAQRLGIRLCDEKHHQA